MEVRTYQLNKFWIKLGILLGKFFSPIIMCIIFFIPLIASVCFVVHLFHAKKLWTYLLPDFPEPVVRRAACGDGAPCYLFPSGFVPEPCVLFFISRRREWRLQPAASSTTKHRGRGVTSPPCSASSCSIFFIFFPIFLAHALRTSSSWQERSRILSSWRASAPPTVMCVWFRTLFTRIPAGVCWCTCLRPAANTVQEAATRVAVVS